jgi:hypothetical protein
MFSAILFCFLKLESGPVHTPSPSPREGEWPIRPLCPLRLGPVSGTGVPSCVVGQNLFVVGETRADQSGADHENVDERGPFCSAEARTQEQRLV